MRLCLTCGEFSTTLHRCDNVVDENRHGKPIECGANLVGSETPVEPFAYRTVAGVREDGLVEVEFERTCLGCGEQSFVATSYSHVGKVIRLGCPECGELTKHRPSDEALRYRALQLGFREDVGDVDQDDASSDEHDHNPLTSTPA